MIEKIDGKEEKKKNKKLLRDAIINLLSERIYMFGIATFMTLGNLITYLLSYLRGFQGEHKTISLQHSYLFSIVSIVFGAVQIIAPAIQNKLGLRCSVIVGTFIIFFSMLLIYFSRLFILDILGYFILALGSFCLPLLDRNYLYYFYEIRGKLIGALSLVSALDSAGLNMFAEKFIVNPQSDEADVDGLFYTFNVSENIRKYILIIMIIYPICALISVILIIPFDKNIHGKDLFHWKLSLLGPKDSPYAGGMFFLTVDFPEGYPTVKPEVRFINQIYHLNVQRGTGHICISTLNQWKPRTPMVDVISAIFALFYDQNPESPYSGEMAREYQTNRPLFDKNAREWTKKYAS